MFESGGQAQADLRWILPLQSGETAWLYGAAPALEASLESVGVKVRRLDPANVMPAADHLLAPNIGAREAEMLIGLGKQAIRPGGYVLLGLRNAAFLGGLIGRSSADGTRLPAILRRMKAAEFAPRSVFGVFYSLDEPRFLVSLETRQPARYFWERLYLPPSRFACWKKKLAIFLAGLGQQACLYSAFVLTAQRMQAEC
jgi:hypothetical protein